MIFLLQTSLTTNFGPHKFNGRYPIHSHICTIVMQYHNSSHFRGKKSIFPGLYARKAIVMPLSRQNTLLFKA